MEQDRARPLRFAKAPALEPSAERDPWTMLIVDDEEAVHQVTKLALQNSTFAGRPLSLLSAYSSREACLILKETPDIAVILLDVVMETEDAGLTVIRFLRSDLQNRATRIILRTGQPGRAPARKLILDYDINDYKEKTELTSQKLFISVYTALRAYRDIRALDANRRGLETVLHATASIYDLREVRAFVQGVLRQLTALLYFDRHALFCQADGLAAAANADGIEVIAATGRYAPLIGCDISQIGDPTVESAIRSAHRTRAPVSLPDGVFATYLSTEKGYENILCVHGPTKKDPDFDHLVDMFMHNVSIAYDNIRLQADLTAEVAERREAEQSAAILARLPGELPEPVMRIAETGHLRYANASSGPLLTYFNAAVGDPLPEDWCRRVREVLKAGERMDTEISVGGRLYEISFFPVPEAHYVNVFGRDVTNLQDLKKRLQHTSFHDHLTGIPNRLFFRERVESALVLARRHGTIAGLILLDLDRFKQINDACGLHTGDVILKRVANRLTAILRETDVVARLGGDEFGVVVTRLESAEVLFQRAEQIQAHLSAPIVLDDRSFSLSCAIGLSVFPGDGKDADTLLQYADIAMYHAKHNTKDKICYYDPCLQNAALDHLDTEEKLRSALEHSRFEIYYQPFFDLTDGSMVGAEALLRMRDSDGSLLSPGHFIPVAEETGLIEPIGAWVIQQVCRDIGAWLNAGMRVAPISFNLSAKQLANQSLATQIEATVAAAGIAPTLLEAEITESVLIQDPAEAGQQLRRLKEIGLTVAIDDFGTGYSSLSYLRHLPVSKLKIDRSFVADMLESEDAAAIVDAILALGRSLRLKVIAEGIERQDQADALRSKGCLEGQGFLFGRPIPESDFRACLDRSETTTLNRACGRIAAGPCDGQDIRNATA